MLPVTNARRRPTGQSRELLSRRATQRPLTSCAFLVVAFTVIYICCVLVSLFRDHKTPADTPKLHSSEHKQAGQAHSNDVELSEKDPAQPVLPPPHTPGLLERLQAPLKRRHEARIIEPDRARAQSLEYEICPASSYSVPSYGPLLLIQRGASTACAAYLYAAPFARTTPLLPPLPAVSDPHPSPPHAHAQPPPFRAIPQDGNPFHADAETEVKPKSKSPSIESLLEHPIMHHFKDPVLSPEQRGVALPARPGSDTTTDGGTLQDGDNAVQSIDDDDGDGDLTSGDGGRAAAARRGETIPNEDPVLETHSQSQQDISGVSTRQDVAGHGGDQSSEDAQGGGREVSDAAGAESQQRRLLLDDPARLEINSTARARSQQAVQLLEDSDQATGVLAAAVMLAAEEMQSASADLERFTTLHTPPATASLPEDIGRWSHIQLDRAVKLQTAWQTGNTSGVAGEFPHALALLNHPSRAALAQSFASIASCVLQRLGGPAKDSPAAHLTPQQATEYVVTWPQYLSYESAESMPTGRETSMPGALMRGVFVAHANGSVILDLFDPRAPLDSEEVQDTIPELYRIELRTGDLALLPPWVLASIVTVPPLERPSVPQREPPTMHEHVQKASAASRYLGFHESVTLESFQEPPHSSHAAILHLALPGEPSMTAGSILPMRMGPMRPPSLPLLQHAQNRQLLETDVYDSGTHDVEDTDPEDADVDTGSGTDADGNGMDTEAEWADQERRLPQPDHNQDQDPPLAPPNTLASPKVLHAPQLPQLLRGQAEEVQVREDPIPGQGSEEVPGHQPPNAMRNSNLNSTSEPGGDNKPSEPSEEGGATTKDSQAQEEGDMCTDVDRIWFSFGSPVSVYSLPEVDPQLDVHALRSLALTAFEAFKNCLPNKGEEFNRESPGSLGDELFEWQSRWPDDPSSPCNGGQPGRNAQLEREWRTAYNAYVGSEDHDRMLRAVATVVVSMLKRMGKDDLADDKDPGIFSWLTVHDASMSYHGRHYHRNQALTAVLYLELPYESAPLEFSNPIEGPDSQPNGRTVFVPTIGDFVLFPSYLSHTVPMRLLKDKLQPRISVAFNIWFEGVGLDRFAEGLAEDERDNIGKHQYFAVSDVTLDRHFLPREGLDLSIERDDHIL